MRFSSLMQVSFFQDLRVLSDKFQMNQSLKDGHCPKIDKC